MKNTPLIALGLSALLLLSCNNPTTKADNSTADTASRTETSISEENDMKKYEDQNLSFEYPKELELKLLKLESSFENATQYALRDENEVEIISFSIDKPSAYSLGNASLDEFIEYNNPDKLEILYKESFKTASGEDVYYFIMKRTDDYHNDICVLIPGTEKYQINGIAFNRSEAYEKYVKNGETLNIFKSLKIKVK